MVRVHIDAATGQVTVGGECDRPLVSAIKRRVRAVARLNRAEWDRLRERRRVYRRAEAVAILARSADRYLAALGELGLDVLVTAGVGPAA